MLRPDECNFGRTKTIPYDFCVISRSLILITPLDAIPFPETTNTSDEFQSAEHCMRAGIFRFCLNLNEPET